MSAPGSHADIDSSADRAYGGMSSEERRQMRRQRLIDAGLEVFGKRGLSHSTMRDICTRARLSDRYFYESFASVQAVFEAVYVQLRTDLLTRLHTAMSSQPANQMAVVEAGLRAFFSFVHEDPRRVRVMLIDVLGLRYSHLGEEDADDAPEHVYAVHPYVSMFGDFFRALYPRVDELDVDVELVHQTMIGMTVQSAAAWADKGFDKTQDNIVRHNIFAWQGLDQWVRRMMIERDAALAAAGDAASSKAAKSAKAMADRASAAGKSKVKADLQS